MNKIIHSNHNGDIIIDGVYPYDISQALRSYAIEVTMGEMTIKEANIYAVMLLEGLEHY